jgi:hypothetical protein
MIMPSTKGRTIIAHFPSSTKADNAAHALRQAGFTDITVKRNTRFGVSYDSHYNNPISNMAESLTGLTLYSTNHSNDQDRATRVLMGSDPSVSGFSARGYGLAGGSAFTLVTFAKEDQIEEAVSIIKENDGEV